MQNVRLPISDSSSESSTSTAGKDDMSYACMSIIALCLVTVSVVFTLLIANHMYTGLDSADVEFAGKIQMEGAHQLIVKKKKVLVSRLDDGRCLIAPLAMLRPSSSPALLSTVADPLAPSVAVHFAGREGLDFCQARPVYLLVRKD